MPTKSAKQSELWIPEPHPTGTGYLPQYVTEQLRAERQPISRQAKYRYCPKCGAIVLRGLDDDYCAVDAVADPTPLTARLEYACYLVGRTTYNAITRGDTFELGARVLRWVRAPELLSWPVLPAHRCGATFPGCIVPAAAAPDYNTDPPF